MKIVATYKTYAEFNIPDQYKDFPLKCFEVRWGKLTIWDPKTGNALVEELEPKYDPEETMDWKRPDTTTIEEDSDDEEEEIAEEDSTRKTCTQCKEDSSCGNYNSDHQWICEDCGPADGESDEEDSDEEDSDALKCSGECGESLDKNDSYYLHFPDGSEEYYCEECKSSLNDNYIKKADYRGYGDDHWCADSCGSDDDENSSDEEEDEHTE